MISTFRVYLCAALVSLITAAGAHAAEAQSAVRFTPYKSTGIYDLHDKVGWTIEAPSATG